MRISVMQTVLRDVRSSKYGHESPFFSPGPPPGGVSKMTVLIDINAASHGWFMDETPSDDAEFDPSSPYGELLAAPNASHAFGRMDLLTVVMHELGYVLGLEDLDPEAHPDDLMSAVLDTGERHLIGGDPCLDSFYPDLTEQ